MTRARIIARDASVIHFVRPGNSSLLATYLLRRSEQVTKRIDALQSITLDLEAGDRLALIGPNGAGKTTLLRLLAGILTPSTGMVEVSGRVSTLFDVGLGMNPELSGRQNVRNRALLLGWSKSDAESALRDVIAFSQLDDFMELPVRTYSAGMFLRLAFAVATADNPDILLMDEGIGLGDAEFRERARERLDRFMERTGVLVVASHDVGLLRRYCTRGLVLIQGRVMFQGSLDEAIEFYEGSSGPGH
jgi:ABC-type polysaccharide/polyol phosphate transport system ATPase subunit